VSNRLIRLAQRVRMLSIGGESRAIWPSEKAVLTCLADDARDADGGVARLAVSEIVERTSINRRTVQVALLHLIEAGLIEREGRPGRAKATTRLTIETKAGGGVDSPDRRSRFASEANPERLRGESDSGVESTNRPIDHSTSAGAAPRESVSADRFVPDAAAESQPNPVDLVFDAWDTMARAKGLPGPVKRDIERYSAVERRIAAEKLWRVLAAVRAVGDAPYLTNRRVRHDGQGDVMADFDFVFGVGHLRGNRVFERLLEGSFTGGRAIPLEEFSPPAPPTGPLGRSDDGDEPDDIRRLREAMRRELGEHQYAAWIEPLLFERDGRDLVAIAPSAFVADWVTSHFASALRVAAGGAPVRMIVREPV
jgi:hypothetical protein